MDKKKDRTRAIAITGTPVGSHRYGLYRNAHRQINRAYQEGFYLEVITLVESVLADRLESRASYLAGKDFSFKPLGDLVKRFKSHPDPDNQLQQLVLKDVWQWREDRNEYLHAMAKLADGDNRSWEVRYTEAKDVAMAGKRLLAKVNQRVTALKPKKAI